MPATSDDFRGRIGLQWQWQANPSADWATIAASGGLRLRAVPGNDIYWTPNLLLQKFPAPAFTADAVLDGSALRPGERGGLIVFGTDYAWIGLVQAEDRRLLTVRSMPNAADAHIEQVRFAREIASPRVHVRVTVTAGGRFRFSIVDGERVEDAGPELQAVPGVWVGAKVGLFASAARGAAETGALAVQRFTVSGLR